MALPGRLPLAPKRLSRHQSIPQRANPHARPPTCTPALHFALTRGPGTLHRLLQSGALILKSFVLANLAWGVSKRESLGTTDATLPRGLALRAGKTQRNFFGDFRLYEHAGRSASRDWLHEAPCR